MNRDKFYSLRLSESERKAIREMAKNKGISVTELFREALQLFFAYETDCEIKRDGGRVH